MIMRCDLGGALADLEDLGVAVEPADRELVHEPVAAEDLGGVPGVVHRGVRGDQLGDRRLLLERLPGRASGRAASYQASRAVCARASMSAIVNWMAWYSPIGGRTPRARRRTAGTRRRTPGPGPIASAAIAIRPSSRMLQELRVAAAPLAEQVRLRAPGTSAKDSSWVSEAFQPTLEYVLADGEARACRLGTMIVEISLPSVPGARERPVTRRPVMSVPGVGDERLGAVDHPLVAVQPGRWSASRRARRCRRPARSARTRRAARPRTGAAATGASAPRCRSGRSAWRPGRPPASSVIATDESTRASSSIARHSGEVVAAHAAVLLRERQAEQPHLGPSRRSAGTGTRSARSSRR